MPALADEVVVVAFLDVVVGTGVAKARLARAGRHKSRVWERMMLDGCLDEETGLEKVAMRKGDSIARG